MQCLPRRSRQKTDMSLANPPAGTMMFSAGTCTLSKKMSADGTPRKPISVSFCPNDNPFAPTGTYTAPIPLGPGSLESLVNTIMSEWPPPDIHLFCKIKQVVVASSKNMTTDTSFGR